jgi:hypothetical protein
LRKLCKAPWQAPNGIIMAEIVDFASAGKVGNDQPSSTAADIIKRGQDVAARLECHLTWEQWHDLICALKFGRSLCMREAKTTKPEGPDYRKKIAVWLRAHRFDCIPKPDRSRLYQCGDNIIAIDAWRTALPDKKKKTLNHPRVVLAHWKRSQRPERCAEEDIESAAGTITIDTVIAWLKSASPTDRARIIKALALTRADISTSVITDVVQHAVGQVREVAEQESVALRKFAASIGAVVKTQAAPAHQLEEVRDALKDLAGVSGPDWLERMNLAGSVFRQPALKRSH